MWMEQFTTFTTKEFIGLCVFLSISVGGFIAVLVTIFRSIKDVTNIQENKAAVVDVRKLSKDKRFFSRFSLKFPTKKQKKGFFTKKTENNSIKGGRMITDREKGIIWG